jgi:hypothetical protein
MVVNQAAWRLSVPWINAGIDATGLLARVQVFMPGPDAPCLECAWDSSDYALVEQSYPCQPRVESAPTNAPAELGALAASLQAIECRKLLAGERDDLLAGRDVLLDARHRRHFVTTFRRNPSRRMPDHEGWRISRLDLDPSSTTLGELLAAGREVAGGDTGLEFGVVGRILATTLTCPHCADRQAFEHVHCNDHRFHCQTCRREFTASGADLHERTDADGFSGAVRNQSLSALGFFPGDVVTFTTPLVEAHFEVGSGGCPTMF